MNLLTIFTRVYHLNMEDCLFVLALVLMYFLLVVSTSVINILKVLSPNDLLQISWDNKLFYSFTHTTIMGFIMGL